MKTPFKFFNSTLCRVNDGIIVSILALIFLKKIVAKEKDFVN